VCSLLFCDCLSDADLAAAYLTAKATNTPRTTADHEELELLLENYSQRFEGIITGVNGALVRGHTLLGHPGADQTRDTRTRHASSLIKMW